MLTQNVADKVDRPRKNDYKPVFLSSDELQQLFAAVKGTKFELPVLVAAFYGFRWGEVLGLRWDAIDLERGTITVKNTVTTVTLDGKRVKLAQDSAKTKSSLRTLPLVGSFKTYFEPLKEAQEANKKVCGDCYNYKYDGYLFVDEMGNLMKGGYLSSQFPKFVVKHGLRRLRYHDLRHPYVKHKTKKIFGFLPKNEPRAEKGSCMRLISAYTRASKRSGILKAIFIVLSGNTYTLSISSSANAGVMASASRTSRIILWRCTCSSCFSCACFASAVNAAWALFVFRSTASRLDFSAEYWAASISPPTYRGPARHRWRRTR